MSGDNCCISDQYLVKRFTITAEFIVVIIALFNDQQQQQEQQNQLQQCGVCVGTRRARTVQRVPYVPDMNMGGPLFRARQFPVYSVREQQHAMLQDRPNQDMSQHNIQHQYDMAYNPRPYQDQQNSFISVALLLRNLRIFGEVQIFKELVFMIFVREFVSLMLGSGLATTQDPAPPQSLLDCSSTGSS